MKVSRLLGMSESHEVGIELDPPSPPPRISRGVFPHRIHSRSASWSFTGGPRPGTSDLSSRVTVLNPITPLTAVIREYVQQEHSSVGNSTMSRTTSEVSLPLSRVASYEDELSDAPVPPHIPSRQERRVPDIRDQRHPPPVNEEQNIGFEISDGIRWLEHNAIFIILLLVKFAWYHRSGLMVIVGMFGTYLHCNQTIKNQVSLKNKREKKVLVLVVLFLAANIYFVYYVFWDQQLYNCLIFQAPHFTVDLWNLLWSIWVTG